MKGSIYIIFIAGFLGKSLCAQKIDQAVSFRNSNSERYFRFSYDNDVFVGEDRDYTQGFNFEWVSPFLKKNPINKLLFKPDGSSYKTGLLVEHNVFTPNNISDTNVRKGERPFSALILLKSFIISTNEESRSRLISSFTIGGIGPIAFGKEMQTTIHSTIGGVTPYGWVNQLNNDLVVNYEMSYERELLRMRDFFAVQPNVSARFGTLYNSADLGLAITIGIINSPFSPSSEKKFQLYFYSHSVVSAIAYDATLQGGVFTSNNPHTLSASSIERFTAQNHLGLILQTDRFYFEYGTSLHTRQIFGGDPTKYGGLKAGYKF